MLQKNVIWGCCLYNFNCMKILQKADVLHRHCICLKLLVAFRNIRLLVVHRVLCFHQVAIPRELSIKVSLSDDTFALPERRTNEPKITVVTKLWEVNKKNSINKPWLYTVITHYNKVTTKSCWNCVWMKLNRRHL